MSTFEVLVREIDDVIEHPNAERLNIVKILGYDAITNKTDDGMPRYKKGDLIVYVPEAAVVPDHLLKQYGYWNEEKDRGMLAGKHGNRVKAIRLRQSFSQGLIWALEDGLARNGNDLRPVSLGDNVAEFFSITKYEPPVPVSMNGEVAAVYDFAFDFDIENLNNFAQDMISGSEYIINVEWDEEADKPLYIPTAKFDILHIF